MENQRFFKKSKSNGSKSNGAKNNRKVFSYKASKVSRFNNVSKFRNHSHNDSDSESEYENEDNLDFDPCKESSHGNIRVIGNDIYFYEDVTTESVLQLNIEIDKLNKRLELTESQLYIKINQAIGDLNSVCKEFNYKFSSKGKNENENENENHDSNDLSNDISNVIKKNVVSMGHKLSINIYIQSYGGDVYAGLSGYHHIKNSKFPINTIVDGYCASAATFLLLGGVKKYMYELSHVLIHQINGGFMGKWAEIQDETRNCEMIMKMLKDLYLKNTKLSKKKLDTILQMELNLSSADCLQYKVVDEIID
jgi:ATP-dependent Clp endopeptidase proteolytic subunit ClpP